MPRNLKLLFILLIYTVGVSAQEKLNIDSLWNVYHNSRLPDTSRLAALQKITWRVVNTIPDSGLKLARIELDYATRIGNKNFQGEAYNNMGVAYKTQDAFTIAMDCYVKCLKLWEEINYTVGIAAVYTNMGIVMHRVGNEKKAIEYYTKSLAAHGDAISEKKRASLYSNIANSYSGMNQDSIALIYIRKSLAICLKINSENGLKSAYGNIGRAYAQLGNMDSGAYYFNKELEIARRQNDKAVMANALCNLGSVYLLLHNYQRALDTCQLSYDLSISIAPNSKTTMLSCECLSEAYEGLGQYEKALNFYKEAEQINDSLNISEKRDEVTKKEVEYVYLKKAVTDSTQAAQQQMLSDAKLQDEKEMRYVLFGGLLLVLVFTGFVFNRFRVTRKQKVVIEKQQFETEFQKSIIEKKNKEIVDSINYAHRIQQAILLPESEIKKEFSDAFVLLRPKDIVSGDFYWFAESEENKLIALADCTGHGVPGGFMSMLGFEILQDVMLRDEIQTTAEALTFLDKKVTDTLNKNSKSYRDGMDMVLCAFSKATGKLNYSGANRPLIHISNGELKIFAPDKYTIGGAIDDVEKVFHSTEIEVRAGDLIYMLTDGYADQFGGPLGKKFKTKQFSELLLSISEKDLSHQKEILEKAFDDWKGELDQVDDVCVIGIRIG